MLIGLVVGVAVLVLGLRFGPLVVAWGRLRREQQRRRDPDLDPFAHEVSPALRDALHALVAAGPTEEPGHGVATALRLCWLRTPCWYWRGGLRQVVGWADRASSESSDPDVLAIEAELRAALGEIERARAILSQLPVDHWRGCIARAIVYEADGDFERAEAALVAAHELGPEAERPWLLTQLGIDT